jgi:hypothetical protein
MKPVNNGAKCKNPGICIFSYGCAGVQQPVWILILVMHELNSILIKIHLILYSITLPSLFITAIKITYRVGIAAIDVL